MMPTDMTLHPDDVALFVKTRDVAFAVARRYALPLRGFNPMPDPEAPAETGLCAIRAKVIWITYRFKVGGQWLETPRAERDVWQTVAHELAHLRVKAHDWRLAEFEEELSEAIAQELARPAADVPLKLADDSGIWLRRKEA
jgi:hypothetical protein